MAEKLFRVSDLTEELIRDEGELARLVVEAHPDLADDQGPLVLDVRPSEVEGEIPEIGDLVVLSYIGPNQSRGRRFFMERADFEKLAQGPDMASVLESARSAQAAVEPRRRRGRRPQAPQTDKIDYASPEHAGEPHRGRATEAEQEYVRAHLPEVNKRLQASGLREIDPVDPKMARRYGLSTEQAA